MTGDRENFAPRTVWSHVGINTSVFHGMNFARHGDDHPALHAPVMALELKPPHGNDFAEFSRKWTAIIESMTHRPTSKPWSLPVMVIPDERERLLAAWEHLPDEAGMLAEPPKPRDAAVLRAFGYRR